MATQDDEKQSKTHTSIKLTYLYIMAELIHCQSGKSTLDHNSKQTSENTERAKKGTI